MHLVSSWLESLSPFDYFEYLAKCLINAETGQVPIGQFSVSGKAYQELARENYSDSRE
jgi:hypothetical protein